MIRPGKEIYQKVSRLKSLHNLVMIECMIASCIDDTSNELGTQIEVLFSNDKTSGSSSYFKSGVVTVLGVEYYDIEPLVRYIKCELDEVGGYDITTDICSLLEYTDSGEHNVMKIKWM